MPTSTVANSSAATKAEIQAVALDPTTSNVPGRHFCALRLGVGTFSLASGSSNVLYPFDTIPTMPDGVTPMDTESGAAADLPNSRILTPSWAQFVKITCHAAFPQQNVGSGYCSFHMFRDTGNGVNGPTAELHYHVIGPYLATAITGVVTTLFGTSGLIPVQRNTTPGFYEAWTMYVSQTSGGTVALAALDNWMSVEFFAQ